MVTCNIGELQEFQDEIKSVLQKVKDSSNKKDVYLEELQRLKNKYDIEDFNRPLSTVYSIRTIRKLFSKDNDLKNVLFFENGQINTYSQELSTWDPAQVESTLDLGSKFDNIDSTNSEKNIKNAAKEHFLNSFFPMASGSRLYFEQDFKHELIKNLFFNSETGRLNKNGKEIDQSVKSLRSKFERRLDEYIRLTEPEYFQYYSRKSLDGKIEYFKEKLEDGLFNINSVEILRIPVLGTIKDNIIKSKLEAYTAYISLIYFDDLIEQALEDSVKISYKGNYNTDNLKYSVNLGDRNVVSWSDESLDIDETELIGGIIRLYMESLDLYDPKNGEKLPFKMTFNDVKSGVIGIMKFLEEVVSKNNQESEIKTRVIQEGRTDDPNNIKNLLKNQIGDYYNKGQEDGKGFDYIWDKYFLGKTLPLVIAATKRSPNLLAPALFAYLVANKNIKFSRYQEYLGVYSIFKNIFDYNNENSLLRKVSESGINLDSADIYSFVTTLFVNLENIRMLEYKRDSDGSLNIINIIQNTENVRLNSLKYQLEGMYNVNIPHNFKSFTIEDFKTNKSLNIRFNNSNYELRVNISDGKPSVVFYSNGMPSVPSNNDSLVLGFLSEVFGKDINSEFMDMFTLNEGNISDLLEIAGTVLYNYKLGKLIQQDIKQNPGKKAKELYDTRVKEFYSKNQPTTIRGQMLPELTNSSLYVKMLLMVKILDFLQGYSGETTAKDGLRKQISLVALSSLMSKYMEVVYNHNFSDPNSIMKKEDFSIYDFFEGVEFVRAYSGNDSKKAGTSFSENEFFAASFIYDFYGQQFAETVNGRSTDLNLPSKKPTKLRVMGPVVADKPRIPKIVVDWLSKTRVKDKSGEYKRIYELTPEDILNLQEKEFGQYYKKLYQRIHQDLGSLNPFIQLLNLSKFSIVWAHPGIGKSWSVLNGQFKDKVIDWDVEYNAIRDLWIAEHSNTIIGTEEFNQAKYEYLVNYENHEDYKLFLIDNWEIVKAKAKALNKILVASPHALLKLFPKDFNAIINLSPREYITRNVQRGGTQQDSKNLKKALDNTIKSLIENNIINDYNVFTTNKFLEDILSDGTLDYDSDFESFNLYCKVRGLNPEEIIHEAIAEQLRQAREDGLDDYSVKIIDNIHFVKGRDNQIHNSVSLFHQLNIYNLGVKYKIRKNKDYLPNMDLNSINETPEMSRRRINLLLISELIQGDTIIKLGTSNSNVSDGGKFAGEEYNKDWKKGNSIVYGRIIEGDNTIDLYSEDSFKKWNEYKQVLNLLKHASEVTNNSDLKKLVESIDEKSPKFNLEKTINIVNKYYKYALLLSYDLDSKSRKIRDSISENITLPNEKRLRSIVENFFRDNNPTWGEEAITRNVEKTLANEKRSKQIYTNHFIYSLVADTFSKKSEALAAYDILDDYVTSNNIESKEFNIEINPEIERYSTLNNWIYESYMLTSVGSFIAHPGNNKATSIFNYEYGHFGQLVKRNVSQTATKHREVQDSLKGIRNKVRMAIVEDEKDSYITLKGDYGARGIKVHDGATWYNGTMNLLSNNSLGADAMGQDKKPFIHFMDVTTGIGGIVKTAGFVVTNDHIQTSERHRRMNKIMNDTIKWTDTLKRFGYDGWYYNWLNDFNDNPIDFGNGWYVYNDGNYYRCYNPKIDENGNTIVQVQKVHSNGESFNEDPFEITFGYVNGDFIGIRENKGKYYTISGNQIISDIQFKPVNSNWELWKVFGGEYSAHSEKGILSYFNDNSSFLNVNYIMNHTGKVVNPDLPIHSQENLRLIIKESQIDMIPTMGAVKFGATNINTVKMFTDDNYKVTYMEVFSDDLGEQLNAEHQAEGGHVSLMTQVINAIGARGYSREEAEECYEALELLALQSFETAFEGLDEINRGEVTEKLKLEIANILLNALKSVSLADGDILSAIAIGINKMLKFTTYSDIEKRFPISSPLIFNNLFSKLASLLEKAAIRLKFDGGMLVLNPSNRIFQLINGKLAGRVSRDELLNLQNDAFSWQVKHGSEIEMGHNYFIMGKETKAKLVDSLEDFYYVLDAVQKGYQVCEAFVEEYSIELDSDGILYPEWNLDKPLGRDLATYDLAVFTKDGREFSAWQFNIVRQLHNWDKENKKFKIRQNIPQTRLEMYWNLWRQNGGEPSLGLIDELTKIGISEINPDKMHSYLESYLQKTLNSVGNGIGRTVLINDEELEIESSKVSPYEAILPMIYKTTFGLEEGDSIGEIENDLYFFVRRLIKNAKSKFGSEDERNNFIVDGSGFDLELKRTSGDHIYLAHSSRKHLRRSQTVDLETEVVGEALYRLHPETKKRMYLIPSKKDENGVIIPNCEIVKTRNGTEIIYTDDFSTILDLMEYNSIAFGDLSKIELSTLRDILLQLELSTNSSAKAKAQHVVNAVNEKALRNKKGLEEGNALYNIIAEDTLLANDFLNYTKRNSISEIFEYLDNPKDAAINALINHELYRNDATNQYKELLELENYILGKKRAVDKNGNPMNFDEWYLLTAPYIKHILDFGIKQHTSFLASLEAIVSRTPAQSLQSFMAMKIAGFDANTTNSIYVNRMLLFLLGSDYDIDKANVLGLKINNGILQGWSPYFNLATKEKEELSETLPFPSGKKLNVEAFPAHIAFDYLEKDYERIDRGDGRQAIIDNDGNGLVITETAEGIFIESVETNSNNYLIEHAVFSKLREGTKVFGNFNKNVFLVEEDGTFIGINNSEDLKWFVESYPLNGDNIKQYYTNLRTIIKAFTKIGSIIPELENIRNIIDKHNTFFLDKNGKSNSKLDRKKREALYNFVSLKVKNISKNPVNLIQGQSGIDVATDNVKDLVKPGGKFDRLSTTPESSDSRTTYARMRLLVLTLTGKDDVGIVASAMKVFEAISHYYYKVLAEGTVEELERLLSNVWVLGKNLRLIANSFVKNEDSIKSDKVLEAYRNVDNTQDAFIMMSALLSLATDNTKDPTLSKLNANPNTIGCYTAGLVLGLNIEEVANLLISDTGIMLSNMTKGNVFNSDTKQFNKLTEAIRYLEYPPKYPGTVDLTDLFVSFGLFKKTEKKKSITKSDIEEIIKKKRKRIRELAGYVLNKTAELETDIKKLAEREVKNIADDSDYYGWQQKHIDRLLELSKNAHRDKKELSEYERLQNKQKKHKELKERLEKYQRYIDNPEMAPEEVKEELQTMSKVNEELLNLKSSLNTAIFKLDLGVKEFFRDVFDWTSRREIIENDFVNINGIKYNRFRQIRKLNSFNDEMGDLRKVLKLNQGLPNAVKDLLSWINQFSGILRRSATRSNRKPKNDNALGVFAAMNNDELDLNLNRFLNDPTYQKAAIDAYEETKIGVNILAVMANSSHYRGYMKTMNLLYEGGKAISINYKSQAWISRNVLPTMNLNTLELNDEFFKKITPVTFNKINQMFLWLQQVTYNIPKFKIIDGELQEFRDEDGKLLYESIRLGTEETNQKFKDYVVNYLYPYLVNNYPDNPFVKAIGLRSYNYNLNREITINLAKTQQYNMTNPTDKVKFNEVKKGLGDLSEIEGIVPALFYYNLIAYNGQPGQQSLTNLFEDFVVYGSNKTINDYNAFITYLDESGINLWTEEDIPYLQQVLAPDVYSIDQLINSNIPFAWILNPENNESVLIKHTKPKKNNSSNSYDEENEYNDYGEEFRLFDPYENMAEEYGYNDDEYIEIHGHYAKYKSLKDVLDRAMGQYTDKVEFKLSDINEREFILGNSIIDSNLFDELVLKDYPDKKLSELNKKEKLDLLKNNKDNIKIRINGSDLTLSNILKIAKNNGWTKEAVYESFLFYKRKSRTETYDYFDIDTLKSRLDTIINQSKELDCNG